MSSEMPDKYKPTHWKRSVSRKGSSSSGDDLPTVKVPSRLLLGMGLNYGDEVYIQKEEKKLILTGEDPGGGEIGNYDHREQFKNELENLVSYDYGHVSQESKVEMLKTVLDSFEDE